MANDADWVADVKRWCMSARPTAPIAPSAEEAHEIGYEAADPSLQSRHWPDAPSSAPADLN